MECPWNRGDWETWILDRTDDLLIINKPAGVAVQSREAWDLTSLAAHFEGVQPHVAHRIDRPCSGLVVLPLSKDAARVLSQALISRQLTKTYLAVVEQAPQKTEDRLVHFVRKAPRSNKMLIVDDQSADAKYAELGYRHLGSSDRYHLLKIDLVTGRQHQIRAQLGAIGCAIKGDIKYGARRGNRDRSIHLHSWRLTGGMFSEEVIAPLPQDALWQYFQTTSLPKI